MLVIILATNLKPLDSIPITHIGSSFGWQTFVLGMIFNFIYFDFFYKINNLNNI